MKMATNKLNRWGFPDLGLGVGLRTVHFSHILSKRPDVGFFEVLTENYLDTGGRPLFVLDQIAEHYRLVMHGVSMSVGSTDPINFEYLAKVKALADRIKAVWIGDHVCWTGVLGRNTHDLLPLPYTEETLRHVIGRIRTIQDFLGRPLVLENPSTYLEFAPNSMPEWEFINRMAEGADCGLLFDVNNVYVSAFNHGFDPEAYVDAVPADRVCQYHLAGHTHKGTHILDTHSDHVVDPVWRLYGRSIHRTGLCATLLEWDADIPAFEVVHKEVLKARAWRDAEVEHAA
jgi:uncharacterized protein (UPF0276 family)